AKFISRSGVSGILAGVYALIGGYIGFRAMNNLEGEPFSFGGEIPDVGFLHQDGTLFQLCIIATLVLILSLGTGILFSVRKARKQRQAIWNPVSRSMLTAIGIPLLAGGLFVLILLSRELYEV